jgi:hypothetical protein
VNQSLGNGLVAGVDNSKTGWTAATTSAEKPKEVKAKARTTDLRYPEMQILNALARPLMLEKRR